MEAPQSVVVRAAERSDADAITDVQVASWRAGYAHVFPPSILYGDDFDSSRRTFWNGWRFAPGHRLAVVCTPGGADEAERVVGFASYGPERDRGQGFTGRGEVWAFYLHPDSWGTGAADELMRHTEVRLRAEGFPAAVLWVLEDNPRARAFYEKHGWSGTGARADFDDYCAVRVPEVEYGKTFADDDA